MFVLFSLFAPWVEAQNFERGEELFEEHCQACHDDMHRPESRHAPSLSEPRKRIEACALHTDARWQQDEVNDGLFLSQPELLQIFGETALSPDLP